MNRCAVKLEDAYPHLQGSEIVCRGWVVRGRCPGLTGTCDTQGLRGSAHRYPLEHPHETSLRQPLVGVIKYSCDYNFAFQVAT